MVIHRYLPGTISINLLKVWIAPQKWQIFILINEVINSMSIFWKFCLDVEKFLNKKVFGQKLLLKTSLPCSKMSWRIKKNKNWKISNWHFLSGMGWEFPQKNVQGPSLSCPASVLLVSSSRSATSSSLLIYTLVLQYLYWTLKVWKWQKLLFETKVLSKCNYLIVHEEY